MNAVARQFEAKPAVREAVGLLIGLVGPSGGGKTYSALRLATGIQRVVGGDIDVIDTENGRALYYAEAFKFNHVRFGSPFSPLDYLEALRFCAKRGAKVVVVDSMSHEHDGVGGVLEMHEAELSRLAGTDPAKRERVKLLAWARPKAARKRLINELLQMNLNVICTFRAKEKLKIERGKEPTELGWQPICGDEFMYEMALQTLLKPGSNGVPTWTSELPGERAVIKLPAQFRQQFTGDPQPLSEDAGEALAQWAAGGDKPAPALDELIASYATCSTKQEFDRLETKRATIWKRKNPPGYKARLAEAAAAARARVGGGADPGTWSTTLEGAPNLDALTAAWDDCSQAFGGMPPPQCEAAYSQRRDALMPAGEP